tara:strand:+ start:95 stop:280 length:186 start_codon:yes stop_codon:yes gene_type:complete
LRETEGEPETLAEWWYEVQGAGPDHDGVFPLWQHIEDSVLQNFEENLERMAKFSRKASREL